MKYRNLNKYLVVCIIVFSVISNIYSQASIESRISALLSKMTIEEKIGQLQQFSGRKGKVNEDHLELLNKGLIGSFLNIVGAENVNEIQKSVMENSRLKIPLIFGLDVVHGYRTIFPVPIGIASTWDSEAAYLSASIGAEEAYASGIKWTFAPMVDIARDPRWGRIVEGAGEDPYLGSIMSAEYVKGFQGTNYGDPGKIVACAKHWVAYGAAESGRDYNTADVSERSLREIYFPPFKAALDAGVGTFMSAFNDINGIPASANYFTLTKVLRDEWKFDGFVVSDFTSIEELINHGIASDESDAALAALTSGLDMEMVSRTYNLSLKKLLESGRISMDQIDEAVKRVLRIKLRAGLFDNPYVDESLESKIIMTEEKINAARKIAGRSIVLLKNDGNILPLKKNIKTIALIGPLTDNKKNLLGSWSAKGREEDVVSLYDGLKNKVSERTKIILVNGCNFTNDSKSEFEKAVKAARMASVVIFAVGELKNMSGEAASRSSISLPGIQEELIKEVNKIGKPAIAVLINGRPLAINWINENIPAILETWYAGIQAGNAIADVIFGDVNPGGKLPVSFPRSVGQIPIYYNHKNTGRPPAEKQKFTSKYIDIPVTPLYPFGYGLSYTEFNLYDLKLNSNKIGINEKIKINVTVKNIGDRSGDEVVQLYIQDIVATVSRPLRELKGFKRITLEPGDKRVVEFEIGKRELGFYNSEMKYVVEPGKFNIYVGTSSIGGLTALFEVLNTSK